MNIIHIRVCDTETRSLQDWRRNTQSCIRHDCTTFSSIQKRGQACSRSLTPLRSAHVFLAGSAVFTKTAIKFDAGELGRSGTESLIAAFPPICGRVGVDGTIEGTLHGSGGIYSPASSWNYGAICMRGYSSGRP
jgi:hypothetical protein